MERGRKKREEKRSNIVRDKKRRQKGDVRRIKKEKYLGKIYNRKENDRLK